METWYGSKAKKDNLRQVFEGVQKETTDLSIADYLKNLSLLRYVPLHYLIPDNSWMKKESLLFFYVDPQWVKCLLEGAAGIGRDGTGEAWWERNLKQQFGACGQTEIRTGFILYSDILKLWPGLRIQCQGEEGRELNFLRLDEMSENMMIGIAEGDISRITFQQPAESLHEGFERREGELLVKQLKKITDGNDVREVKIPCPSNRVVSVKKLKKEMEQALGKALAPAEFGQQMAAALQAYTLEKV